MKIIGIICEYNPLHNGHIYHLKKIKEMYPDSLLILVLNGYFLERGEISILSKKEKTKASLQYGVDIVLELPVLWGCQSADIFAKAAIEILHYFYIDTLVFGSELNNIDALTEIVDKIESETYQEKVKELLKKGVNYPTALASAIDTNINFNHPNDLLAISYLKVLKQKKYNITPVSIKRTSDYHDLKSNEEIISASNIRHKLENKEDIKKYVPNEIIPLLKDYPKDCFFKLLKAKILTTPQLEKFLTVDEGIESRLVRAIKKSNSFEEFISLVKTKRYTYNKINRMCIHILLGITKEEEKNLTYCKVLGFNNRGKKYLHTIKDTLEIPLTPDKTSNEYQTEMKAAILYDLLFDTNTYAFELQNKPIQMKDLFL